MREMFEYFNERKKCGRVGGGREWIGRRACWSAKRGFAVFGCCVLGTRVGMALGLHVVEFSARMAFFEGSFFLALCLGYHRV